MGRRLVEAGKANAGGRVAPRPLPLAANPPPFPPAPNTPRTRRGLAPAAAPALGRRGHAAPTVTWRRWRTAPTTTPLLLGLRKGGVQGGHQARQVCVPGHHAGRARLDVLCNVELRGGRRPRARQPGHGQRPPNGRRLDQDVRAACGGRGVSIAESIRSVAIARVPAIDRRVGSSGVDGVWVECLGKGGHGVDFRGFGHARRHTNLSCPFPRRPLTVHRVAHGGQAVAPG